MAPPRHGVLPRYELSSAAAPAAILAASLRTLASATRSERSAIAALVTELLEAGAVWAETPKDTALGNEVVMSSLPGPLEVEAVILGDQGVLEGAGEGTVHVDLTTNAPSIVRRLHRICGERDVGFLDACVSKLQWSVRLR